MVFDEDQKKCGGITLVGFLTIAVCVAMTVVGGTNFSLNKEHELVSMCKAEPNIPYYLIIGGILTTILLVGRFILQRCCRKCGECAEGDKTCSTICCAFKFSCISFYDIFAVFLTMVWLVVGTRWVFAIRDEVQHKNDNLDTYCPSLCYEFSFWLIVAGWIFIVICLTLGIAMKFCKCFYNIICCKPCEKAEQNQPV